MRLTEASQEPHYKRIATKGFYGARILLRGLRVLKLMGYKIELLPHGNISYCELIYAS